MSNQTGQDECNGGLQKEAVSLKATFAENTLQVLPGTALWRAFDAARLQFVDIGARGGSMTQLQFLAPFAHYIACEPEPEEAIRLAGPQGGLVGWKKVSIVPKMIASKEGSAVLHVTRQPGLSSSLTPNADVVKRFYRDGVFDVVGHIELPAIGLDSAAEEYGFREAGFLKIDTQGTELDILTSGRQLLSNSVIAVYVECEFQPFYVNQPLFADVDAELRGLGFCLFDLNKSHLRRAGYRAELFSRRQVVWAHALYLKDPDTVCAITNENDAVALLRLLAIVLAFDHNDLAIELVAKGHSASVLKAQYGEALTQDVLAWIRERTRRVNEESMRHCAPDVLRAVYKEKYNQYL